MRSDKTEHHTGQEERILPAFSDLLLMLQEAFDEADDRATVDGHSVETTRKFYLEVTKEQRQHSEPAREGSKSTAVGTATGLG